MIPKNEKDLIIRAKKDMEARNLLFKNYYPLCVKVWGKDVSEGFIKFCDILTKYDIKKHTKITSFYNFLYTSWSFYKMNHDKSKYKDTPISEFYGEVINLNRESPRITDKIVNNDAIEVSLRFKQILTKKENEVLKALLKGLTSGEIMAELGLNSRQKGYIYKKLKEKVSGEFLLA